MNVKYLLCTIFITLVTIDTSLSILFVNPDKDMVVGILYRFPMNCILPTLAGGDDSEERSFSSKPTTDLHVEPGYNKPSTLLQAYFQMLGITSLPCQQKLMCEIADMPLAYRPLSDIFLQETRLSRGPLDKSSYMSHMVTAVRKGLMGDQKCSQQYKKCLQPAYKMINMSVLKVWQYLTSKINVELLPQ